MIASRGPRSRWRLLPSVLVLLLGLTSGTPASGLSPAPVPTTTALVPAKAWVLVDVDTANVLDAGNDRTPLPPASLTKVITALAALGSLPPGVTDVPVSARAAAMPASKINMKAGEVWTLDDTLHALFLSSANDAALALAERAGGTVEGFQKLFAATAANLGFADDAVLNDPAGLDGPEGVEGGNLVSARDLAIAARALLAQPTLAAIVATPIYYFTGPDGFHHRLTNHNYHFLTTYPGAIGVKTGYTHLAGPCLIAAARRGGRSMLAVVLNSDNPALAARVLLDKGFATPADAEPAADRLPPVQIIAPTATSSGRRVPSSAPASTKPPAQTASPASPASPAPQARRVSAIRPGHSTWSSWASRAAIAVVAIIGLLRLRAVMRARRRRRRRHSRSAHSRR